MKGGGYSSFLENLKIDGNTNCLAKFIIIDGDRAASDHGEKKKLQELAEYCILQNNSGRKCSNMNEYFEAINAF